MSQMKRLLEGWMPLMKRRVHGFVDNTFLLWFVFLYCSYDM